ncbi:molybdate ABC transporter permease subunit [Marinicrinis sediminis]|uniref:Molybdenum transport system permease n=1 Tax=Marinicrinis sediminis TaxID=1652465 RepID=A0ABW5R5G8_9BACL
MSGLSPLFISVKVVGVASVLVFIFGLYAAWRQDRPQVRSRRAVMIRETLFMLPLVLPPSVIGLLLLYGIGTQGPAGHLLQSLFGGTLVFTWWAAVIAAIVTAFPLVYQTLKIGFSAVSTDVKEAARSMGASEWQCLRYIMLPMMGKACRTAYLLGLARGLGEFGATWMVAGNIPGKTQTIPLAIYSAAETGQMTLAWSWTLVSILLSLLVIAWMQGGKYPEHAGE